MDKLDEIVQALAATTPGKWDFPYAAEDMTPGGSNDYEIVLGNIVGSYATEDDAFFMARAHDDYVPWLIREVWRLRSPDGAMKVVSGGDRGLEMALRHAIGDYYR